MRNLYDFIIESNMIEGIHGEPSPELLNIYNELINRNILTVDDMINFVNVIEPGARLRDNLSVPNVQVGGHIAPRSSPEIREQLKHILAQAFEIYNEKDIWSLHCEYEMLHPFTDGNGRSGRLLWLWCMNGKAPLSFLHQFYYQTLGAYK